MEICSCGRNFSFENAHKEPAPPDWQNREVWVCNICQKIHHAVQDEVAVVRGPENARQLAHALSQKNGQHILTWSIGSTSSKDRSKVQTVEFFPWPRRFPMTETEPLIFKTWELLMEKVSWIMREDYDETFKAQAKHQARGIAEVLAILMKPFIESADDVVRHAVEYHKDNSYEVPGLGLHLWNPLKNPDGSDRTPVASPRSNKTTATAAPKRTGNKIPLSAVDGVAGAINVGMFTVAQVAKTYNMTEAEVKDQLLLD